jgi:hypothetical protein
VPVRTSQRPADIDIDRLKIGPSVRAIETFRAATVPILISQQAAIPSTAAVQCTAIAAIVGTHLLQGPPIRDRSALHIQRVFRVLESPWNCEDIRCPIEALSPVLRIITLIERFL